MNDKFASTIAVYNKHASKFVDHFEKKRDLQEPTEFLKLLPPKSKILDAGCGTARDAAYFISQGYQAIGIDLSEGLLQEAKKLHPEVQTQLMSLTEITFPENHFDGVWCKAALLHIDRTEAFSVLQSFYRILKPGGVLFLQTKEGEGEGTQPVPFDDELTRFFTFYTMEQVTELIERAGFLIAKKYEYNTKDRRFDARDQQWLVVFAKKE